MDFIRAQAEKLIHSRQFHNRWNKVFLVLHVENADDAQETAVYAETSTENQTAGAADVM